MLEKNVVTFWLFTDCYRIYLFLYKKGYTSTIKKCNEGYWINVSWSCGVTSGLTYRELEILELSCT